MSSVQLLSPDCMQSVLIKMDLWMRIHSHKNTRTGYMKEGTVQGVDYEHDQTFRTIGLWLKILNSLPEIFSMIEDAMYIRSMKRYNGLRGRMESFIMVKS